MIRPVDPSDSPALIALAVETGVFQPHEAETFREVLDALHAGGLGEGHQAHLYAEKPGDPPAGWVYFGPAEMVEGVWNLWWIGVAPARQGRGIGGDLLGFTEGVVRAANGRILIIETSTLARFDPVRRFYAGRGYAERGRVPDYYAEGDGKVIFSKRIGEPPAVSG